MKWLLDKWQLRHCLYKLDVNFYVHICFLARLRSVRDSFSLCLGIFRMFQLSNRQYFYWDLHLRVGLMWRDLGRFLRLCCQKMKEYFLCIERCSLWFVCCHLCCLFILRIWSCMGKFDLNRAEKLLEEHQTMLGLVQHIKVQRYMHQCHLSLILNLNLVQLDFLKVGW